MTFREKPINKLYAFALAALFALTLAGCGGGGGGTTATPDPEPPPMPTAYEQAVAAIAAAETEEAAQAAYDAVKEDVTAAQGEKLQAAVDARIMAIQTAARVADQKEALSTAAGNIDTSDLSTQEAVDAANEAIRALRQALEDAEDVSDEDKATYMSQLDDAVAAVDTAQGGIDTATRRTNQTAALTSASGTLQTALAALAGSTPTQTQLDAANNALTALNAAITGAADLTDAEKAEYVREAANAEAPINTAQMAFDAAEDEDQKAADAAAMADAKKLHAGIGDEPLAAARVGEYGTGNDADKISVTTGTGATPQLLSEDKDATVVANHGWTGKKYTASGTNVTGTYEAYVYSNVGEPTMGKKFGNAATGADFEYLLVDGALNVANGLTDANADKVVLTGVTRTAGTETFKLPDPNTNNEQFITVPGSFHGVSGTYICDTGADRTGACTAAVAETKGFTLGGTGGTWTFKPTDPNTRLMETPDGNYASYGWWLHKSADGNTFTASAFVDDKGTGEGDTVSGLGDLNGTATYMGGAAGKYALHSTTGGTNEAGHFIARATLEANFSEDSITGTIDNFMVGADGESRDWSVELKEAAIADGGAISRTDADDTVWTIGGTAADASGEWSGSLQDNGTDGVPKVGTGTFYTQFGRDGRMVGAFGVNKQ